MQAVQTGRSKVKKLQVNTVPDAPKFLEKSNFEKKGYQTQRMLNLRKQGYSNSEIAKLIGCCRGTVVNRIGPQPEAITKISMDLASESARASEERRRRYRANASIENYNKLVVEFCELQRKALELYSLLRRTSPEVKRDCQYADIKPLRLFEVS